MYYDPNRPPMPSRYTEPEARPSVTFAGLVEVPPQRPPSPLRYAGPDVPSPPRRSIPRGAISLTSAAICLVLAFVVSEDLGGSGQLRNPLRYLATFGVVLSLVAYVWARTSGGPDGAVTIAGRFYRFVIVVAPVALLIRYRSLNAVRIQGVYSLQNPYFRMVLMIFALAGAAAVAKVSIRYVFARTRARRRSADTMEPT